MERITNLLADQSKQSWEALPDQKNGETSLELEFVSVFARLCPQPESFAMSLKFIKLFVGKDLPTGLT